MKQTKSSKWKCALPVWRSTTVDNSSNSPKRATCRNRSKRRETGERTFERRYSTLFFNGWRLQWASELPSHEQITALWTQVKKKIICYCGRFCYSPTAWVKSQSLESGARKNSVSFSSSLDERRWTFVLSLDLSAPLKRRSFSQELDGSGSDVPEGSFMASQLRTWTYGFRTPVESFSGLCKCASTCTWRGPSPWTYFNTFHILE